HGEASATFATVSALSGHSEMSPRLSAFGWIVFQKSFPPLIKNSPGFKRDFGVKMWGTSSPDDKLAGDFGNVIEATQIGGRQSNRFMAGKLSPANCRLLQQYRGEADVLRPLALPASVVNDPFVPFADRFCCDAEQHSRRMVC